MTSPYMPSEYVLSARADSPTRQLRIDGALARDPAGIGELRELIHGLVDEGRTVLLSSHLLDEIERTCDAVAIVNDGKVIAQGTHDELTAGGPRAIDVARTQRDQAASLLRAMSGIAHVADHTAGLRLTLGPDAAPDRGHREPAAAPSA
jgi:ABC-2 type transport system ATP-binding protein